MLAMRGATTSVPSTQYGIYLELIELTGWTWQELTDQPADLIDEMCIRVSERFKEERRRAKSSKKG